MGRPPKPTEQKRLAGNPGKRNLGAPPITAEVVANRNDPVAVETINTLPVPDSLGIAGTDAWRQIADTANRWVAVSDAPLLRLVCELIDRRSDLAEELKFADLAYTDANGVIRSHPLLRSILDVEKQITSTLSLLGLSPVDRTRLGVAEVTGATLLEDLLAKRAKRPPALS